MRCSRWYEDIAAFRAAARDLEQMLGNILGSAVAGTASLAAKLDVIQAFAQVTTREGLRWVSRAGTCRRWPARHGRGCAFKHRHVHLMRSFYC